MQVFFNSFLVVALDQISKYLVVSKMELYQSIPVIEGVFHLTYVHNTGAAFSILQGQRVFFSVFSTLVILAITYGLIKYPMEKRIKLLLSLVLGGAIGNLIDRVRFGYVIDFFDFRVWPVFNIADCAVVIGATLLALVIALHKGPETSFRDDGR